MGHLDKAGHYHETEKPWEGMGLLEMAKTLGEMGDQMKTETKQTHTPGPWYTARLKAVGKLPETYQVENDGKCIADNLTESDARLIAVAPELLDIVRMVSEFFENNTPVTRGTLLNYGNSETATLGLAVRQAIAKVEAL